MSRWLHSQDPWLNLVLELEFNFGLYLFWFAPKLNFRFWLMYTCTWTQMLLSYTFPGPGKANFFPYHIIFPHGMLWLCHCPNSYTDTKTLIPPPLFTTVFWWSTHSSAPYTGLAILCTELRIYQIFMEIPAQFYKLDNCGPPGSASCSLIQLDKKLTSNYHPLCLKGIMCRAQTESIDISENLRPQTSSPHEWYI